jgi:2-polyprenyl-6-methoxyphenol hydroxylase-like FAD-dependent oxidoreductase
MAIPPPLIRPEVLTATRRAANELLAPQFAEVVRHTRQLFFQAIFDLESPRMMYGRTALLGDAAFVARPHCGMGVSKAAGDAMALVDVLCGADMDIAPALAVYETQRSRVGKAAVRHGRDLGAYLQGSSSAAAAGHHTPQAVMREIATQEIT